MKIGFIAGYNDTHYAIYSYHPALETIPPAEQIKMPEYKPLPDDYEPQPNAITLMDKVTGEISFIAKEAELAKPTVEDVLKKLSQIEDMNLYLIMN